MCSRYARSGGSALRFRSIWRTGGFVSSPLRTGFPIIQCFAVPGTSAFAKAVHCAVYLRAWWRSASRLDCWRRRISIDASRIRADVDKKKRMPGDQPIAWPKAEEASRAVCEYLQTLDAARSEEESGRSDDDRSIGGGRRKPPKEISLTDPQAAWVARKSTDPFFAYDANYLIDNKAGIIVDAEGTRANRLAEIAITETMIEHVKSRFDLRPRRLAGDTVYGAVRLLKWLVDRGITPHIPVWDKSARSDGTFSRSDFVFHPERNIYVCPGGAKLTSTGNIDQGHIVYYRASKNDCSTCSLKPKCTTAIVRKITRDHNEEVRDQVRALANTDAFHQSRRERKKVEMRFAHMKRILACEA